MLSAPSASSVQTNAGSNQLPLVVTAMLSRRYSIGSRSSPPRPLLVRIQDRAWLVAVTHLAVDTEVGPAAIELVIRRFWMGRRQRGIAREPGGMCFYRGM